MANNIAGVISEEDVFKKATADANEQQTVENAGILNSALLKLTQGNVLTSLKNAAVGILQTSGFVPQCVKDYFSGDIKQSIKYLEQNAHSSSETHTAVIMPSGTHFRDQNLSYSAGVKNILSKNFNTYIRDEGVFSQYLLKGEGVNQEQGDVTYGMYLSMPIYQNAKYTRKFEYTKEPIPAGNNITEFMCAGNRKISFTGTISDIFEARQLPFQSSLYRQSALERIATGIGASLLNNYGARVATKARLSIAKNKTLSTATSLASQAYDLVTSHLNALTPNPRTNTDVYRNELGKNTSNSLTLVQLYISMLDNLASIGHMFQIYYTGLQYTNMAITNISINNAGKHTTSKNVSIDVNIDFEQQIVTNKSTNKIKGLTSQYTNSGSKKTSPIKAKTLIQSGVSKFL